MLQCLIIEIIKQSVLGMKHLMFLLNFVGLIEFVWAVRGLRDCNINLVKIGGENWIRISERVGAVNL